jgi:hypothetical protein
VTYDGRADGGRRVLRAYVDGEPAGTVTTKGSPLSSYGARDLMLGGTHHGGGDRSRVAVEGDLIVHGRVLSAEEIRAWIAREAD